MRQPARIACLLRYVVRYLVVAVVLCFAARAHADDRADARAHYQAGLRFYGGGDYQGAIREFSAAQQLLPADLNNYNLALCYDKLGDAEPAIQYYRAFLDKQPGTDKRAEIEASISRLEAAQRSAAGKKRPKPAEVAPPAEAPPAGPVLGPPSPPAPEAAAGPPLDAPPAAAPGKKHHGPAVAAPTGDPQLDRANAISIDDIRDQRGGMGAGAGMTAPRDHRGPAVAANEPPPPGQPGPDMQGAQGAQFGQGAAPMAPPPGDEPAKEDPIYKKWWFWGIVAVTGVVVYEIAFDSSSTTNTARVQPTARATAMPGGLTLLRW